MTEVKQRRTMHKYSAKITNTIGRDEYMPVFASSDEHALKRFDEMFMSLHNNGTPFGDSKFLGELAEKHEHVELIELMHYDTGAVIASLKIG